MSLKLNKAAIIEQEKLEQESQEIYDLVENAKQEIFNMGLKEYPQPDSSPQQLTEIDVNQLSNTELAALYSQYVAYTAYMSTKVAELEALKKAAKDSLTRCVARIKSDLFKEGVKDSEVTTRLRQHPTYLEYDMEYAKIHIMHTILSSYYKAYDKSAQALSRNIEIRKLEFEQHRRDGNVSGYRSNVTKPDGFGKKGKAKNAGKGKGRG